MDSWHIGNSNIAVCVRLLEHVQELAANHQIIGGEGACASVPNANADVICMIGLESIQSVRWETRGQKCAAACCAFAWCSHSQWLASVTFSLASFPALC